MGISWPVRGVVAGAISAGTDVAYVTAVAVIDDAVRRGPIKLGGS